MKVVSMNNKHKKDILSKLTDEIDEALKLLRDAQQLEGPKDLVADFSTLPSNLFDQCLALCEEYSAANPEPVRTVHHLACSGGTLISKCIASMPNTQVLSEVDPLSNYGYSSNKPKFAPTNMVALMRQSSRGTTTELILELFLNNLEAIYFKSQSDGLRLILRDHAHSHYCVNTSIPERPSLLRIIETRFSTLSVVVVRDPIDSYLSLQDNGWLHFSPATFDEYCGRYITFIRSYKGLPIICYEDFVENPAGEMEKICNFLDLPFNPDFQELFRAFRLSGDSGRAGVTIEPRPRRSVDAAILNEMETSTKYQAVRPMLGYQ